MTEVCLLPCDAYHTCLGYSMEFYCNATGYCSQIILYTCQHIHTFLIMLKTYWLSTASLLSEVLSTRVNRWANCCL